MPADDRPYTMGDYRTEVVIATREDGTTEIRRPDMDEPLILNPGEQVRIGFGSGVTVEGYIDGIGWEDHHAWRIGLVTTSVGVRDRPAWMWMPTLRGPLRLLWPLYRRWSWWRERRTASLDEDKPNG